jgi:hypothetical protein
MLLQSRFDMAQGLIFGMYAPQIQCRMLDKERTRMSEVLQRSSKRAQVHGFWLDYRTAKAPWIHKATYARPDTEFSGRIARLVRLILLVVCKRTILMLMCTSQALPLNSAATYNTSRSKV